MRQGTWGGKKDDRGKNSKYVFPWEKEKVCFPSHNVLGKVERNSNIKINCLKTKNSLKTRL